MSRVTVSDLLRAASRITFVPEAEIRGAGQQRWLVHIRWAVMTAAKRHGHSSPLIGRVLGDRDHTTVVYGWQRSEWLAARDPRHGILIADIIRDANKAAEKERLKVTVAFSCFQEAL